MEFAQISEVIGLASSAVGLTGKAADTVEAIKGLWSSEGAPDKDKTAQLLNTLATELTSANMMNVQLSEALRALSQELQRQDEFEREKARYELMETPEGDIVYRLRADKADGQPIHYICPVCMSKDRLISFVTGDKFYKNCQANREHGFRFAADPEFYGGSPYVV